MMGMAERRRGVPKDAVNLTENAKKETILVLAAFEAGVPIDTLTKTDLGEDLLRLFRKLFTGKPLDADVQIMGLSDALNEETIFDRQRNGSGPKRNHRRPGSGAL